MFNCKKLPLVALVSGAIALSGCGGSGNKSTEPDDQAPAILDTTAPVLLLSGSESVTAEVGSTYVEQGASAIDNIDGSVSVITLGSVDTSVLGTNTITYTATDAAGNTTIVTRQITVTDTTAPVITLVGSSEIELLRGEVFVEPGVTALDSFEGIITVATTGAIDNTTAGTYTLTYTASDSSGNPASSIRTITVLPSAIPDTTAPLILLSGSESVAVEAGSTYVEQGASAIDNVDGSVPVITLGSVDTSALGINTVTYTATDAAGNTSTVTREVIVADTTAPVITLAGNSAIELLRGATFIEPETTIAVDSFEGALVVEIEGSVDNITIGAYTLTYSATDSSGNFISNTRTITVVPSSILSIQSKNYFTGSIIEGAEISVSATENGNNVIRTGLTNANGELSISVADDAERIVVSGDASGYGETSEIILAVDQVVDMFLQPVNAKVEFIPTAIAELEVSGLSIVTLPANSLVDEEGNAAAGNVSAELTVIDPSIDPSLMPGNFETIDSDTGVVGNIESFGAVNVTFADTNGSSYNLAPGQTATVRIPLASGAVSPPATIPLYHFDEETGYWMEEGTATLAIVGGESYYEGTVSHFSTWNADILYESVQINGCVNDGEGNPEFLVGIQTQGVTYSGQASTSTDIAGNFSIAAKPNSTVLLSANTPNGASRTTTIVTGTEELDLDTCITLENSAAVITLTWGENPNDLDTQFFGPSTEAGDVPFLVYYGNQEQVINDSSIWLDVDDTSSYGPEITTISSFPYAGRYSYAVKHFSGSSDIAASPTRVELDHSGQRQIFSPPEGDATKCWAVFDFVIDDAGVIAIEAIGAWKSDSYCDGNRDGSEDEDEGEDDIAPSFSAMTVEKKSAGILKNMIESKYYSK
jgi:hypothetical protein